MNAPLKQCSRKSFCIHPERTGDGWLPATTDYFHRDKSRKDGFNPPCKVCESQRKKDDRKARPDELHAIEKAKRENRIDHYRELSRKSATIYRTNNHDKVLENTRNWRKENAEYVSAYNQWYRENHPEKNKETHDKRWKRLKSLPDDFTIEDLAFALNYFDNVCAVCGRHSSNELTIALDHWIPLSDDRLDNPGSVPENLVPLCNGKTGCNGKKHALDPVYWVLREYGQEQGEIILDRIQSFFRCVRKVHDDPS